MPARTNVALPALVGALMAVSVAEAQQPPAPGWPPQQQQPQYTPPPPGYSASYPPAGYVDPRSRAANIYENAALYGVSAAYGVGLGIWFDAEVGIDDPGVLLIAPTVLGVGAPVAAYLLNQPPLRRGVPAAIAAGTAIGAGEGLGIASLQMATADNPWGFRGLSRSMVLGSTLGGVGGYFVGELQQPSPNISVFAGSGVLWGTLAGSMIGLGASRDGLSFHGANDWMARGGFIGFNVGLAATAGLSTVFVPSMEQLSWMWIGAGAGALVSLPVYLFYIGDDAPPAKHGLVFTATAMTLGIVAGGVFGPTIGGNLGLGSERPRFASIEMVMPWVQQDSLGIQLSGTLY
jgi:hypothetical protein